jgi:hypothetical protein
LLYTFSGSDLAPREFPQTTLMSVLWAFGNKHPPICPDNDTNGNVYYLSHAAGPRGRA